jgi:hypothetical protein
MSVAATRIVLRASPVDFIEISGVKKFGDGSGYTSSLEIRSGRFSCAGHTFYFDDLDKFTLDLRNAYHHVKGKAWLGDRYEKDFVEVHVQSRGHVSVSGFIVEYDQGRQELRFAFGCDQTFLPPLLNSLNQVSKELLGET